MEDNLVEAFIMAFSVIVFIIALTLTMYMFSKVTYTSEVLTANADTTRFYENVEMKHLNIDDEDFKNDVLEGRVKIIDSSSIIPTLYRYYKENFCVKIYDATKNDVYRLSKDDDTTGDNKPRLIQIFDMTIEGKVNEAVTDSNAISDAAIQLAPNSEERISRIRHNVLLNVYNKAPSSFPERYRNLSDEEYVSYGFDQDYDEANRLYMFGAPWVGSTENTKKRIDYFISGSDGYINNQYINYIDNPFALALRINEAAVSEASKSGNPKFAFTERVISYSYTGSTEETEEGDVLVNGAASKDKLVIIYTIIDNDDLIVRSQNRE